MSFEPGRVALEGVGSTPVGPGLRETANGDDNDRKFRHR